jgi:hypothetical protein
LVCKTPFRDLSILTRYFQPGKKKVTLWRNADRTPQLLVCTAVDMNGPTCRKIESLDAVQNRRRASAICSSAALGGWH